MKRTLIGITAALILLCSCSGGDSDGKPSQSIEENVINDSAAITEVVTPVSSSGLTGAYPDEKEEPAASSGADSSVSAETTSVGTAEGNSDEAKQGFIGVWSTDEFGTEQILIYEITPVSVKFNTGVSGLFGFDATAMLADGKFVFGDGISPGYGGPEGLKGTLEFSDTAITITYEDFGTVPDAEYYQSKYTFSLRDENSDEIISQHKASLGIG